MRVQVTHDAFSVEIRYWPTPDGLFDWRVRKDTDVSTLEPTEATIEGTRPSDLTAETATEQAQMLRQAAKIALQLDMAIKSRADFRTILITEADLPNLDGTPHIAFTINLGGGVQIIIPKQSTE